MRRGALPAREQCAEKIRGPSPPPCPHPSRRPWLGVPAGRARWRSRFPPRRAGGLLRLCRSLRAGDKGSLRRFAPLRPLLASGPSRSPPPALPLGGGFGVPSRPCRPLPAGASAAPAAAGGRLPSVAGSPCGGVSWSLCLAVPASCRSFAWFSVPPGAGSRPGAVPPWACRSAVRVARCRGLSPWPGSVRSPPRPASRCLGVGACRPAPAFAPCVRWPVGLRFPCRFAGACRRAGRGCAPCLPPVRLRGCAVASCSFCGVAVRSVAVGGGAVVVVSRVPAALPACLLFPAAAVRPSLLALFPTFPPGLWSSAFVAAGLPVPPLVVRVPLGGGRVVRRVVARLLRA